MAGVIKGGFGFGYIPASGDSEPIMKTIYGQHPIVEIPPAQTDESETQEPVDFEFELPEQDVEQKKNEPEINENQVSVQDAILERERMLRECEEMRSRYEDEAEQLILRAKEKAAEVYEKTREMAQQTIDEANEKSEQIKNDAADEGRKQGYDDGHKKGYDEGYVAALKKCRDTLVELKSINEQIIADKERIFLEYEHQLFDTIFEIAQKVTVNSFKQKDKAVISKMIKEAGKRYRSSKNVKISLSSLDISEAVQIDDSVFADAFRSGTNVEIEILKDAPEGTLILDDGAEITDAGVPTQLKMIEQLGKGKYRDKNLNELIRGKMRAMERSEEDEES